MDKWKNIAWTSKNEIETWLVVFNSMSGDFMPFSKTRLNQNEDRWFYNIGDPGNIDDIHYIELCSYFSHFLNYNKSFAKCDLAECTIKDFKPVVKVVLNYEVIELTRFPSYNRYINSDNDIVPSMLNDRRLTLNQQFEWNENNIQKILQVNSWLWKMTDELKKELNELQEAFQVISSTDSKYKKYFIKGQIEYHGSETNDIASAEIQKELSHRASFRQWNLRCSEDKPKIRDKLHENEHWNWNILVYRDHLTEEQQKVYFHYLMNAFFVGFGNFVGNAFYSFEDLVRMREEDFKICLEINWFGDDYE